MAAPRKQPHATHGIARIISGGQTGADRAALDVAIELGIPHGGWVPLGRRAENGVISDAYELMEMATTSYDARTRRNVEVSDATLIISDGPLTTGSLVTQRAALHRNKSVLHIDLARMSQAEAVIRMLQWLDRCRPRLLNVAGPRRSTRPGIYLLVRDLLRVVFGSSAVARPSRPRKKKKSGSATQ